MRAANSASVHGRPAGQLLMVALAQDMTVLHHWMVLATSSVTPQPDRWSDSDAMGAAAAMSAS